MNIKFDYVHNGRTLVVHAEIINPEPESNINERDSFIEEVTTKRGKMYPITRQLEHELEVAALKCYQGKMAASDNHV